MDNAEEWFLYLLYHTESNRTYIGVTKDVMRRLKEHRGLLVGGARFTTRTNTAYPGATPWSLVGVLSSFPSQSEVMRWERLIKMRCRGLRPRWQALYDIAYRKKHPRTFSEKQVLKFPLPLRLVMLEPEYFGEKGPDLWPPDL